METRELEEIFFQKSSLSCFPVFPQSSNIECKFLKEGFNMVYIRVGRLFLSMARW